MRSQRACEILAPEGFTGLINMVGGVNGGPDASGMRSEAGWADCGHPLETVAQPERTWAALQPAQN